MDENIKEEEQTSDKDIQKTVQAETETSSQETNEPETVEKRPSELSQVVWPKAGRLWSETFTVVIVAAILAVIIFFVDLGLRSGIEVLIK